MTVNLYTYVYVNVIVKNRCRVDTRYFYLRSYTKFDRFYYDVCDEHHTETEKPLKCLLLIIIVRSRTR